MVPPSSYLSNSALKHLHWSCLTPCPCSEPCMCGQRACLILFLCLQRLQEEAQWLMVVEYVRALMQKRLVCRSGEERRQLAQQMVQDDQQFRELFHGLVRRTRPLLSWSRSSLMHYNTLQHHSVIQINTINPATAVCESPELN